MKAQSELRGTADVDELVGDLTALDAGAALGRVAAALCDLGPVAVVDELIVPAALALHRRHRRGVIDDATAVAAEALARRVLAAAFQPRSATPDLAAGPAPARVVVATPPGSGGLDADAACETLIAAGIDAHLLSGVEGGDSLAQLLGDLEPVAMVVAASEPRCLPAIAGLAAAAGEAGVAVAATGAAFGVAGAYAARVGATAWAGGTGELCSVLDGWRRAGGALAMNVSEPEDAALVRVAWPAVVMAATGSGGPDRAWAERTVRETGEFLLAALWAGDVGILLGWIDDQLARPDRTHTRDVHVLGILDAVGAALPVSMGTPAAMIGQAREHARRRMLEPAPAGAESPLDTPAEAPAPPAVTAPAAAAPRPSVAPRPHLQGPPARLPDAGQGVADMLVLVSLAAQTTAAVVAVPQPGGRWSALAHGLDQRDALNDGLVWSAIATRNQPVEIADLGAHPELSRSPLAQRPLSLRWAYGVGLREPDGTLAGVLCLMDRWLRQATKREQKALTAAARQVTAHLRSLRRPAEAPAPNIVSPAWGSPRPAGERHAAPARRAAAGPSQLLRSHEVAVLFDVTERTVINWAAAGKLPSLRTIGGHLRFRSEDVHSLLSSRQVGG